MHESRLSHRRIVPRAAVGFLGILAIWLVCSGSVDGTERATARSTRSDVLSSGDTNVATDLNAEARCNLTGSKATGRLVWKPTSAAGNQQRVDITMFRDGFETGNFKSIGPFPAGTADIKLDTGEPGIHYYWRVSTLTREGWIPSKTERLIWPVCPGA
jgi:hypothetical protein